LLEALSRAAHRPGRPKDIAKREAIIKAARDLFASEPFELVTMEAVFETIVTATADQMIRVMTTPEHGGLRERLTGIGTVFLTIVLGSDICMMTRTLPLALRGNRALADRFYAAGPGRVRAALSAIIGAAVARGELAVDDPDRAADDLVGLWEGGMPAKIAFGLAQLSTSEEIEERAARGTDVFLRAYRTS
jgi:TetR/AcrR family transcriptional repressor of mexJK operon